MGIDTGLGTDVTQARSDKPRKSHCRRLERETGIEPASLAWKARVLPLNYSRSRSYAPSFFMVCRLVEEAGFEPA